MCSTEHLTAAGGVAVPGGGSSYPGSARTSATTSLASSRESSTSNPGPSGYRVVMLGSAGVGKSSLINQFMTSEYLHAYDTSLGKHPDYLSTLIPTTSVLQMTLSYEGSSNNTAKPKAETVHDKSF